MADVGAKIKVTLVRSLIGQKPKLRKTAQALGLRKRLHSVVLPDTADVRGMLRLVEHLIRVEPVAAKEAAGAGDSE